jgi:hypothetical protein
MSQALNHRGMGGAQRVLPEREDPEKRKLERGFGAAPAAPIFGAEWLYIQACLM